MVRSLVECIITMLNTFPPKHVISETLSTPTIVEGKPNLDLNTKIIHLGAYALVYSGTANNMKSRAVPVIDLRRSNSAGGYYFMSLHSSIRIHGYSWDKLPIDNYIIETVDYLVEDQGQFIMHKGVPSF